MKSNICHNIKHRQNANDEFYTPNDLAKRLIEMVNLKDNDIVLSSAYGTGRFYNNYPKYTINKYTENFFDFNEKVDWIVDNPPYSKIDDYLNHSADICNKGFGYLLGINNLTARRIEDMENKGFYITKVYMCKVFKWFGMSLFVIWEKDKKPIIQYDRVVWRDE